MTGEAAGTVAPWAASGRAPNSTVTICMFAGPSWNRSGSSRHNSLTSRQGKIEVKFVAIPTQSSNQGTLQQLRSKSRDAIAGGLGRNRPPLDSRPIDVKTIDNAGLMLLAHIQPGSGCVAATVTLSFRPGPSTRKIVKVRGRAITATRRRNHRPLDVLLDRAGGLFHRDWANLGVHVAWADAYGRL